MNPIFQWGLELIREVQTARAPVIDALFLAITSLGSKEFYFLLLPLLLWSVDFVIGVRVAVAFLLATYVNISLKDLFSLPRPFELDPSVKLYDATGYGLPSGHAQLSVIVWGTFASAIDKTWSWIGAGILAALIGFSRIYLGVHFPTDVLMGWLIGILLLATYVAFHWQLEKWLEMSGLGVQLTVTVILSLALLLVHGTEDTASLTGVLAGAGIGVALLQRSFDYDDGGSFWQRGARFLLGVAVLLALRFGLKAVSPEGSQPLATAARFLRYGILGLWIGLGAPWLFKAVGLTTAEEEQARAPKRV
jgi:membrane-associated phospholipid phosphatase